MVFDLINYQIRDYKQALSDGLVDQQYPHCDKGVAETALIGDCGHIYAHGSGSDRCTAPVLLPHLGRYLRLARDQLSDMELSVQQNRAILDVSKHGK